MRLISSELHAYKRLTKTIVNLDAPVIALVGPNEAGKTSFLVALEHLNAAGDFQRGEVSRHVTVAPDKPVISALYLLDQQDHQAIKHLDGAAEARWFYVEKRLDGKLYTSVRPNLKRNRTPRTRVVSSLRRLGAMKWAGEQELDDDENDEEPKATLAERLKEVADATDVGSNTLSAETLDGLRDLAAKLKGMDGPATLGAARDRLETAVAKEAEPAPGDSARGILATRRPQFLRFDDEARSLASEYDLAGIDLGTPPAALENLADLAELDLRSLLEAVQAGDYGPKEAMLETANERLAKVFADVWKQSSVTVRLGMDETALRIFVTNYAGGYSAIAERSDGLRAFVALTAFTALAEDEVRPILLVDEAETHLHYDAQADLVRVFTRQQSAAQVIYTTHSAGCLPEDLGTGVRVLQPIEGTDRSVFRNSFWVDGEGGFTPLLIGMGASALAFASTRYAAIAEGGADVILLPTLLKEAMHQTEVGFQVPPGLAEVSREAVASLDLTAARVAYVVDNDAGGRRIRRKLRAAGIPDERIVTLGRGTTADLVLEDTLKLEVYQEAVNAELSRSHGAAVSVPRASISRTQRPSAVARWCKAKKVDAPNRAAVAARLVEARDRSLLSAAGRGILMELYEDLSRVLGLES